MNTKTVFVFVFGKTNSKISSNSNPKKKVKTTPGIGSNNVFDPSKLNTAFM